MVPVASTMAVPSYPKFGVSGGAMTMGFEASVWNALSSDGLPEQPARARRVIARAAARAGVMGFCFMGSPGRLSRSGLGGFLCLARGGDAGLEVAFVVHPVGV